MASSRRDEGLLGEIVDDLIQRHVGARRFIVAYSGGRDSHVLLHLLASRRERLPCPLSALHVHHGLEAGADDWADHCRRVCDRLGVPLEILVVDARPRGGEGPEAAAREARYRAIAGRLAAGDRLLTAHHQDDQAETVLLQLLRGSGLDGLAAMPVERPLGAGYQLRPFLDVGRRIIERYARDEGLEWIDDPSNESPDLARGYLRNEIMPRLAAYWPSVGRRLARSARHCAEARTIVSTQADADWRRCRASDGTLIVEGVRGLDGARRRALIRHWLAQAGLPCPAEVHVEQIERLLDRDRADGRACVDWPGGEVRPWRGRLHARRRRDRAAVSRPFAWSPFSAPEVDLPEGRLIVRRAEAGQGVRGDVWRSAEGLEVRFRRGGERFRPAGRAHRRRLKSLLQEAGVPPWHRAGLPLLYRADELVAVPGVGVAEGFAARDGERGFAPVYVVDGREYRV